MRPFNLGQAKIAERRYCRQHVNQRLRVIGLLMVLMAGVWALGCTFTIMTSGKASAAKLEIADVSRKAIELRRGMSRAKAEESRRKWQNQLASGSVKKLDMLESVLACVPDEVWLVSIDNSEKGTQICIDARSASLEGMSNFTESLRVSPMFSEVQLGPTRIAPSKDGASIIQFSVIAKIKGMAPANSEPTQSANAVPAVQEAP